MLTEVQRMQLIGDEFPLPLVQPAVIAKVDSVALAVESAALKVAREVWRAINDEAEQIRLVRGNKLLVLTDEMRDRLADALGVCRKCGLLPGCPDCRAVHDVGLGA
jgi:hypothetical protein